MEIPVENHYRKLRLWDRVQEFIKDLIYVDKSGMTYEQIVQKLPEEEINKVDDNIQNGIKIYLVLLVITNMLAQCL